MKFPLLNSEWYYVGPGEGRGERHRIIQTGYEIITSSVFIARIGHSWMGTHEEFSENFKLVA